MQLEFVVKPDLRALMEGVMRNAKVPCDGLGERGIALYGGGTDTHMVIVDLGLTEWTSATLVSAVDQYGITGNGLHILERMDAPDDAAFHVGSVAITIGAVT